MNRWIVTAAVGLASFALGCLAGWYGRERTEVKFEEVTEEELEAYAKADMEKRAKMEEKTAEETPKIAETPSKVPSSKQIRASIDTQKTDYWAKWTDEAQKSAGNYRSRGELEEGEEPVYAEEELEDVDLDNELVIDEDEKLPVIEISDEAEYNDWLAEPDGEYAAISLTWFAGDNVVLDDEDNSVITEPLRNLGFDPKREFAKMNLGKNDSVSIYRKNNVLRAVFQVSRYPASYAKRVYQEEYGGDDDE